MAHREETAVLRLLCESVAEMVSAEDSASRGLGFGEVIAGARTLLSDWPLAQLDPTTGLAVVMALSYLHADAEGDWRARAHLMNAARRDRFRYKAAAQ